MILNGDLAPQSSFMPPMFGLRLPGEGAELDLDDEGGAKKDGVDAAVAVGIPVATLKIGIVKKCSNAMVILMCILIKKMSNRSKDNSHVSPSLQKY